MGYDLSAGVWNDADAESHATGGKGRTAGTAGRGGRACPGPRSCSVRKVYKKRLGKDDVADPAEEGAGPSRTTHPGRQEGRARRPRLLRLLPGATAGEDEGHGGRRRR